MRLDGISDRVHGYRTVFCGYMDTALTAGQLAEEHHLRSIFGLVSQGRIRAARLQLVRIVFLVRVKAFYQFAVGVDTRQRIVRRINAGEEDAVRCFIAQRVGHVHERIRLFPQDSYLLRHIFLGITDRRQFFLVCGLVMHRVRTESRDTYPVDGNVRQLGRRRTAGLEVDLIRIARTFFRLHFDIRYARAVRSRDGHLLSRRFVHRDDRTLIARQLNGVLQVLLVEACERRAVQVNHIEVRVG